MNKLELFRIVGESHARSLEFHMGPIGERKADWHSIRIFEYMAREMYPWNDNRREWAVTNMTMFYTQECERNQIMGKLKGDTSGDDILEQIRKRAE